VAAADPSRLLGPLAWARLGLATALFALGPYVPLDLAVARDTRVVLLVGAAASGGLLLFTQRLRARRMATLLCLLDVALITAAVSVTGGPRSLFTFLYVPSVTAAAILLPRTGTLAMAGVASTLYIGLVFVRTVFPVTMFLEPLHEATALETLTMFLNSGTLLIVAIVAGDLAEQFRSTRRALEIQTRTLRDLQAFKDLVLQSVGTGLIALDREHGVTAFNHAAEEITGWPAAAAIGARWAALFGDAVPLDAVDAAIARDVRASTRHEITLDRPDGSVVPVRITCSALHSGDDARVGLLATCEDLSVIREMEERMRQADRLATLGRMSANIAHEIRNPLASLSGAIETLIGHAVAEPERERLAQIVLRESDRLNTIIKNFLEYARPAPLAPSIVNVAEVVEEVLVLLEHRANPGRLKIVRDVPPTLGWRLDPQQFRQALWNLCLNALEAMPEGGELRVVAVEGHDRLRVAVSDTGGGIPPRDLEHVFEPFFSTKPGGSGLGLALVHRVALDHAGSVAVRSTPEAGTVFTLSLPRRHG
jgi:two-component system sensor histidine kinase PilS (NtrC family)